MLGTLWFPAPLVAQQGYQFLPSVSISEVHDDNIFLTSDSEVQDLITRITPAVELGYDSIPISWNLGLSLDAENYRDNPELDDDVIRQRINSGLAFGIDPNTEFSLDAEYLETQTPGELNLDSGLERGRFNARRTFVSPGLTYHLNPSTSTTLDYSLTQDRLSGGVAGDRHLSDLRIDRQISEARAVSAGFTYRRYRFNDGSGQDSHLLWGGLQHSFSPVTSILLKAGPRKIADSTRAYLSASLTHEYASGELGLNYLKDETTLIGEQGRREVETAGIRLLHRIGNDFELEISPMYGTVSRSLGDAEVFRFALDARYRIFDGLHITGAWNYSSQDEAFPSDTVRTISRNVVLIGVTISRPAASRNDN